MIDPDVKKRWCEALRSGDYRQATGVLYRPQIKAFCCLGVLAKVEGYTPARTREDETFGRCFCDLPENWLEARFNLSDNQSKHLVQMNDYLGSSFSEIADWIEANL